MIFCLVRAIVLDILRVLDSIGYCYMFPLPTIFALRDIRVHVGSSNGGNKLLYIKTPVNKTFGLTPTLNIPNINLDNRHVRLWWHLDNSWFWGEDNVVKNLVLFDDAFHISRYKTFVRVVMRKIGYAYDL